MRCHSVGCGNDGPNAVQTEIKMKLLTTLAAISLVASMSAIPLSILIEQEHAKLATDVTAWNTQCSAKPFDTDCIVKRGKISAALGTFVSDCNSELEMLNKANSTDEHWENRKKHTADLIEWGLRQLRCLGRSNPECSGQKANAE